jgi:hypothetical protein
MYYWVQQRSVEDTAMSLEVNPTTIHTWFNLMRDVPYIAIDNAEQMGQ